MVISAGIPNTPTWTSLMESNITTRSNYVIRHEKGRPRTRAEAHARSIDMNRSTSTEATRKVFVQFCNNTTLLGLSHFLKSKNLLWLIAWLICAAIGIAQSWGAGQDLVNNTGTQKISISSLTKLKFPSVTMCSYNLLPENFSKIDGYNYTRLNSDELCDLTADEQDEYDNFIRKQDDILLNFYRYNLSESTRFKYSSNVTAMVRSCIYNETACNLSDPNLFFYFNNPFYGNCVTFNPGFMPNTSQEGDLYTKLLMNIRVDTSGWLRIGSGAPKIGLLFHTAGTAPVLESPSVNDLRPGDNSEYTLRLNEINFDPNLSSGCRNRNDPDVRKQSLYYSEKTPYRYSIDACMKTCYQKVAMKKCHKIDPIVPVQPNEKGIVKTHVPPVNCAEHDEGLSMEKCGCPLPCKYLQYSVNPDTTTLNNVCNKQNGTNKAHMVRFSVNFLTNIVESVTEVQEYSLPQFFGILGGNLSLWIGFCIISFLELVELVWQLIKIWIFPKKAAKILSRSDDIPSFKSMIPKVGHVFNHLRK